MKRRIYQKIFNSLFLIYGVVFSSNAQNPIVPTGMYIADPEAHVWQDGRLYIYGSRDESDDFWCSYSHHILATSDLKTWEITEDAFASKGENDEVAAHDKLLFAPDCAYANGTYYMYFCSPGETLTEGVATSKHPLGPFTDGKIIEGAYMIDPAVLIDNDGAGYYYWGQNYPMVAKLDKDLLSIDQSTTTKPLDAAGNKAFHEGSSIRRIGDKYYLVFADESRRGRPTCLGYAIGDSPMGPFEYKGIIIDNYGSDPAVWNNHGSIEAFNGQWYVFYHRSTNNSQKFRKACIEPITIDKNGLIAEVEMTSQGVGKPLAANSRIEGEVACLLKGNVRNAPLPSIDVPQEGLTKIHDNDHAVYKYLIFPKNLKGFEVKTLNQQSEGYISIRIDGPEGTEIGKCTINANGVNATYQLSSCPIQPVKGKHALYLVFHGKGEKELFDVDWFRFY